MKLTVGTITDRGLNPKRTANEDRLLALPERGLFLVADGVGGRRAGQVASQAVVDVFSEIFAGNAKAEPRVLLEAAIIESNRRIFAASVEDPELSGMATTLVALALDGAEMVIAHVGDSRIYRFERGAIHIETEDHSEINEAVRAGLLSPALAAQDHRRNVITRALGVESEVEADYKTITPGAGARFLLCSDGITRHIPDVELESLLAHDAYPQEICRRLKELCFERGAEDNLTAVVVDLGSITYHQGVREDDAASAVNGTTATPGSRIEVDWRAASAAANPATGPQEPKAKTSTRPVEASTPKRRKGLIGWLIVLLLVTGAFVFGRYSDTVSAWAGAQLVQLGLRQPPVDPGNPAPTDPDLAAARVLFEEQRYEKAREQLTALAARSPEKAEIHYLLGRASLELKNYPEAIRELNEAARIDAALPDVYRYLAQAYEGIGDRRMKEESLRRAGSL